MGGTSTGVTANNPTIVSAFDHELFRGLPVVLVIAALVGLCWNILRAVQLRRAVGGPTVASPATAGRLVGSEPVARRLLRIAFGIIWIFDGVLQA